MFGRQSSVKIAKLAIGLPNQPNPYLDGHPNVHHFKFETYFEIFQFRGYLREVLQYTLAIRYFCDLLHYLLRSSHVKGHINIYKKKLIFFCCEKFEFAYL